MGHETGNPLDPHNNRVVKSHSCLTHSMHAADVLNY